jgi:NDP-sugar pyrophosphorylase family protein
MKPILLILAAGIGSRYGGIKQLDQVGPSGESIMEYSIYDAIRAGFGKVIFVINRKLENDFQTLFQGKLQDRIAVEYAFQELDDLPAGFTVPSDRQKPWGTGHAVLAARNQIDAPFAAINADDFYGTTAYRLLADFFALRSSGSMEYCMVGFRLANTLSEHGTVSRGVCDVDDRGFLRTVVERTSIGRRETCIAYGDENHLWHPLPEDTTVSMNCWGFTPIFIDALQKGFIDFLQTQASKPKAEYFIPNLVGALVERGEATVQVLKTDDHWFGVTYREDKPTTTARIRALVDAGLYPTALWK